MNDRSTHADRTIDWRRLFSRTGRSLTALSMATAITLSATAGGQQETDTPDEPQDDGTRIEIPDPERSGEDTTDQEGTDGTAEQDGPVLLRDEDGNIMAPLNRPAWAIAEHENRDLFQSEVSAIIEQGYVPVGMEATEGGRFTILYSISPDFVPQRWLVEEYTPETINEELSQRIVNGWNPLAFTVLDGLFYVMLSSGGHDIGAWRIHQTALDTQAVQEAITAYQNDGYALVDFSIDPTTDQLWYLFVDQSDRTGGPGTQVFINGYPRGEPTVAGISQDFEQGRGLPFGLASGSEISLAVFAE